MSSTVEEIAKLKYDILKDLKTEIFTSTLKNELTNDVVQQLESIIADNIKMIVEDVKLSSSCCMCFRRKLSWAVQSVWQLQ